jgi:aminoglycoside phosphotransferase (APT) family kinase protein
VSTVEEHRSFVASRFPDLGPVETFEPVDGGWDVFTYIANGGWIVQFPRLPGTDEVLRREATLLEGLQGEVSGALPAPSFVPQEPPCLVYRRIEGTPIADPATPGIWPERLGRFLYDLHLVPPEFAGLRASAPAAWREAYRAELDGFTRRVFPLLEPDERTAAERMFSDFVDDDRNFRFATGVVHRDLGPEHVLLTPDGDLAGVIDWGDAGVGDPAIDFAWLLHRAPEAGERALEAYGGAADERFLERAAFYDRLGPWYEVTHGLDTDQPGFVASGLAGVRDRLPGEPARDGPSSPR